MKRSTQLKKQRVLVRSTLSYKERCINRNIGEIMIMFKCSIKIVGTTFFIYKNQTYNKWASFFVVILKILACNFADLWIGDKCRKKWMKKHL
jgi:hypothetical protein